MVAAGKPHHIGAADGVSAVDKLVLSTVNAPYRREITAAALQICISDAKPNDWLVHVATFFTDVSPRLIFAFAETHGISKSQLAEAYQVMNAETGERNPDLEIALGSVATVAQ